MITKDEQEKLIKLATQALDNAYAPYSKFKVGAALLTEDGDTFTGGNIENISYGFTNCGERTAVFNMVSQKGPKAKIKAIAVTTEAGIACTPCGGCRQVILEFSTPETIIIHKGPQGYVCKLAKELLPDAFIEFSAIDQDGSSSRIQKGA